MWTVEVGNDTNLCPTDEVYSKLDKFFPQKL